MKRIKEMPVFVKPPGSRRVRKQAYRQDVIILAERRISESDIDGAPTRRLHPKCGIFVKITRLVRANKLSIPLGDGFKVEQPVDGESNPERFFRKRAL